MSYIVEIDTCNEKQWADYCAEFSDYSLYQTWAYQESRAEKSGQKVVRIVVKDSSLKPVLLSQFRIQKVPLLGFKIAYAQKGPLVKRRDNTQISKDAFNVLRESLYKEGVSIIRFAPNVIDNDENTVISEVLAEAGFQIAGTEPPYRTFMVDVSDSEEGIRKRLRKSFRRDLKKAESAGLRVEVGTGKESFDILSSFYSDLKERKGFKGLEIEEFSDPQGKLDGIERMKIFVAFSDEKAVASLLSTELGNTSIVLLAAANEEGFDCGASYLLWYRACVSAYENGMVFCDLGGIDPENNQSVYKFKSRLGGEDSSHIGIYDSYRSGFSRIIFKMLCVIRGLRK